jgi:hypothetical protein
VTTIQLGDLTLARVSYADVEVAPELVGLDADALGVHAWAAPTWIGDGTVRVGASAWVVSSGDRRVVIDPFLAADDVLHDPAYALAHADGIRAAFSAAGLPVETIDSVLVTHVEGLGFVACRERDGWTPFFPNARVLVAVPERMEHEGWVPLRAAGLVDTFGDGDEIVGGLVAERTGDHDVDHHVFHVGDPSHPSATFLGHLALSPVHLASGPGKLHLDSVAAWATLQRLIADDRPLVGSLWPAPGAGRWTGTQLQPLTTSG